jgi:hypothetical protein
VAVPSSEAAASMATASMATASMAMALVSMAMAAQWVTAKQVAVLKGAVLQRTAWREFQAVLAALGAVRHTAKAVAIWVAKAKAVQAET